MADERVDDTDDTGEDLVPRSHIRQLEEKAKKAGELEAQLEALQREAAFARALGGLDHPGLSYFQKGYDGPLDTDAIRNAAKEAGFIRSAPEAGTTPPPDTSAQDRIASASEGAREPAPPDLAEAIAKAESENEVLDLLEQAAARGENVPITTRSYQ